MSLIPEASFKSLSIGTACQGPENSQFTCLGVMEVQQKDKKTFEQKIKPSLSNGLQHTVMSVLHYNERNL